MAKWMEEPSSPGWEEMEWESPLCTSHAASQPQAHMLCVLRWHMWLSKPPGCSGNTPGLTSKQESALGAVQMWVANDGMGGGPFPIKG